MATKVCTSCKKIMRFEDTHCRTCGKEYKQTIPKWMIAVVVIATLALSFVFATPNTSVPSPEKTAQIKAIEQQTQSRMALQGTLKDSSSAEIRNHKGYCGEVNSKNSFGGYTGFKRFIASPAIVAIEGENIEADEFQKSWDVVCK